MTIYAEGLMTPHMDIAKAGVEPEKLLESARFLTIAAAYDVSEKTYDDQVEAAYDTARLVRQSLRFESYLPTESTANSWLSPPYLAMDRRTNCHGYSIVTSECLDYIGVPHYVAFANQHSFIVLQSPDGARANLIDTPVKELYVDADGAIPPPSLAEQMEAGTSGANQLQMSKVLDRSGFSDREKATYKYPWISFASQNTTRRRYSTEQEELDTRLMLRTYNPAQGREVLEAYGNFVLAVRRSVFEKAHDNLERLDGEYPDIDRRNRFRDPTRLIRHLGQSGQVSYALRDIEIIENSLWATEDLVVHLWPADEYRHLGVALSDQKIIGASIEKYEAIIEKRELVHTNIKPVEGRIEKAKKQWRAAQSE